ncbi:MAG: SGNH/GDSL hydrolase family protein [Candidatus Omnitrophica bacterium]|nr:SGNH/GDSL hydrolase family protein [Candidatus Omnitrophota bacterium]
MRIKNLVININIVLTSVIILLFFCECFTRGLVFVKNRHNLNSVINSLPKIKNGDEVYLAGMIQPSIHKKVIYELRPDIFVRYDRNKCFVKTNSQGWRSSRDYKIKKDKDTVRIIGLGDSFMFGSNVEQGSNLMDFLEAGLNERFPEKKWEVINTAVPGYNTVMEVETLKKKGLKYNPDIVIIEFIGNDAHLPNFIYKKEDFLNTKRSFFWKFLLSRYRLLCFNFNLYESPLRSDCMAYEFDPSVVPEEFKDMVGWDSYVKAMMELKKMQVKHGFNVVSFLTLGYKNDKLFDISKRLKFNTTYNDAYNPHDLSLVISKTDPHPSALGHKRNAELLLNFMISEGIIAQYLVLNE